MTRRFAQLTIAILCLLPHGALSAQGVETAFQKALYLETVQGRPDQAIKLYLSVLDNAPIPPNRAAETHLRLGICYRLEGDSDRSKYHFTQVSQRFPSQSAAKLARKYLGERDRLDPAAFMPPDLMLYTALPDPANLFALLGDSIRATPIENPVDDLLSPFFTRNLEPKKQPGPLAVRVTAALLNKGFIKELQKTEALAVGVPVPVPGGENHQLAVFLPGKSDFLFGVFQGAASLFDHTEHRGFLLFQWDDDPVFVAIGDGAVLLGNPRDLVEQAIDRYRDKTASLATDESFTRSARLNEGALVLSFAGQGWAGPFAAGLQPAGNAVFAEIRRQLSLDKVHPISTSLDYDQPNDTIHLKIQSWNNSDKPTAWNLLKTQPLDLSTHPLRHVPVAGLLASRVDQADVRLERGFDLLDRFLASLPNSSKPRSRLLDARQEILSEQTRPLFESLNEVALIALQRTPVTWATSWGIALGFDDPAKGEPALREVLAELLHRQLRSTASREFQTKTHAGVAIHYLEPFPEVRVGYFRVGSRFVVAVAPETLVQPRDGVTTNFSSGVSKGIHLHPPRLVPIFGLEHPEWRQAFESVKTVSLSSYESDDLFTLVLTLPDATESFQGLLRLLGTSRAGLEENADD